MKNDNPIGLEIKNVRKQLGLTQEDFARLFNRTVPKNLHTTRSDVSRYERGACGLPAAKYKKFLSLL